MFAHVAYAATNFSDAVGHWADDEIRTGVEYGYIGGYPDNRFYPDNAIKRSEFVKAVNAAMGFTELGNIAFEDVLPSAWYYDEVRKAASAGYISGYDNGMWFAPDNPITREEVAAALYRLDEDKTLANPGYRDIRDIEWSLDAVRHAFAKGYMTGFPDGNFYPRRNLTRAEVVNILNKFIGIDRAHRMITELSVLYSTDLTAYFSVRTHTAGTMYWEILPASYPEPDALQVREGKMANGQPAPLKGNIKLKATEEYKFNVFLPYDNAYYANIPEYNGAYTLYAVVGAKTVRSLVANVDFSTGDTGDWAEDWLAPLKVRDVTANTAVLDFKSVESGMLYYVVMPRTRGVPTQNDIAPAPPSDTPPRGWNMDPPDYSGEAEVVRDVSGTVMLQNLKAGTDYTVYAFVLKDPALFYPAGRYPNWRDTETWPLPNVPLQDLSDTLGPGYLSNVASFAFKTQGQSLPSLASVAARINDKLELEIDAATSGIDAALSGNVTVYYAVWAESGGAVPPTPAELKAGVFSSKSTPLLTGSFPATAGTYVTTGLVTPPLLTTTPNYRLYAVAEGSAGGGSDSPAEYSQVIWSDLFAKTPTAPNLAISDGLRIQPIGWGLEIFGGAAPIGLLSGVYNYTDPDGTGINVPNTYKTVRVTPKLPTGSPATATIRVNGKVLPSAGYVDLAMPATAGTPFQVKVDVDTPGAQTLSYTVLLEESVPAVTKLYVANATNPNPSPDGNGNYEVRLQPSTGQKDVAVRIDIEPEMKAEFIVNGISIGPVLPPDAFNGWQFTIPLNESSPTDVTIKVVGPTPTQEVKGYTLRINY
jgi:hypothetical protein